jgi:arginyl-tRNA synthetase
MQVIFAALKQINPELAAKQSHLTNGTIRFGSGEKMSSRLGNVSRAADVLTEVNKAVTADDDETRQAITLGAIKYSFLKHRLGGDIAFDINESVSLDGNSGPYLQYAYARACSIIRKAEHREGDQALADLEAGERLLVRKLSEFNEVVIKATEDLMPHLICTYLYELAQTFNRFYEQNRVIGHERELARLELVKAYAKTLQTGLRLLGIPTPEKM